MFGQRPEVRLTTAANIMKKWGARKNNDSMSHLLKTSGSTITMHLPFFKLHRIAGVRIGLIVHQKDCGIIQTAQKHRKSKRNIAKHGIIKLYDWSNRRRKYAVYSGRKSQSAYTNAYVSWRLYIARQHMQSSRVICKQPWYGSFRIQICYNEKDW